MKTKPPGGRFQMVELELTPGAESVCKPKALCGYLQALGAKVCGVIVFPDQVSGEVDIGLQVPPQNQINTFVKLLYCPFCGTDFVELSKLIQGTTANGKTKPDIIL